MRLLSGHSNGLRVDTEMKQEQKSSASSDSREEASALFWQRLSSRITVHTMLGAGGLADRTAETFLPTVPEVSLSLQWLQVAWTTSEAFK